MKQKNKYIFSTLSILLLLIFLLGVCFFHSPKQKILNALRKTFLLTNSSLSITEPLVLLQDEFLTFHTSFTLNQLKLAFLTPSLSSKLSLIEGLSMDSRTNYSLHSQKSNSLLTLSYLYKPYLQAFLSAKKETLLFQVPELLTDSFSIETTTFGKDFNKSIFSDFLAYQLPEDFSFSVFPSLFSRELDWKDAQVTKQNTATPSFWDEKDLTAYLLQFPNSPPITFYLNKKSKISGIALETTTLSCLLKFTGQDFAGDLTTFDSIGSPLYHITFSGSYRPQAANNHTSITFSSIDITNEEETFLINLYGNITLDDAKPMETPPLGHVHDFFHLSKADAAKFMLEITKNLLTSELQPLLPYLGF